MSFNPNLKDAQVLTNDQLMDIFKVSNQGGMRKSNATNSLILIVDHTKEIYDDRWENDILHYTGMGLVGDQRLDFMQNKTLYESNDNGVNLFLFVVLEKNRYIYKGRVKLAEEPYQEDQPDKNGNNRRVWIFPLSFIDN